jgi:hypothetical protein
MPIHSNICELFLCDWMFFIVRIDVFVGMRFCEFESIRSDPIENSFNSSISFSNQISDDHIRQSFHCVMIEFSLQFMCRSSMVHFSMLHTSFLSLVDFRFLSSALLCFCWGLDLLFGQEILKKLLTMKLGTFRAKKDGFNDVNRTYERLGQSRKMT